MLKQEFCINLWSSCIHISYYGMLYRMYVCTLRFHHKYVQFYKHRHDGNEKKDPLTIFFNPQIQDGISDWCCAFYIYILLYLYACIEYIKVNRRYDILTKFRLQNETA